MYQGRKGLRDLSRFCAYLKEDEKKCERVEKGRKIKEEREENEQIACWEERKKEIEKELK